MALSTSCVMLCCQVIVFLLFATLSQGQLSGGSRAGDDISTTITPNTTVFPTDTTTLDPGAICRQQLTCDDCVKVTGAKCYFCYDNSTNNGGCHLYPAEDVLPTKQCPLSDARWGVCWVNFQSLIIAMSVIAGAILVSVGCACYCCCCKGRSKGDSSSDQRFERESHDRQQRHADRRAEREAKMTAIRQKYGLHQDTASYSRME